MREVHVNKTPVANPTAAQNESGNVEVYAAKLARERRARHAAESLLESKSIALRDANSELETLLSGSISLLTDVLAMAKPELFQKAAKVQRWARLFTKHYKVDKPWELDLAALLYPIGIIGMQDWIVRKYSLGHDLTLFEQKMIDESALSAFQLVNKIPRMKSVARALLYCRSGYDGSGYPEDGLMGEDIPQSARILRILIDFVDRATGEERTRLDAFKHLVANKSKYDTNLLKIIGELMVQKQRTDRKLIKVEVRPIEQLTPHDVVARDIVDTDGKLLLAAGAELTPIAIKRLGSLKESGKFTGEVAVGIKAEPEDQEPNQAA